MKSFEQVYNAFIAESIAEAKKYVKQLNKEEHARKLKAASSVKTKSIAPRRREMTGVLEEELNVRLSA
jgi:hypothetical protein